jgi:hypothetical protein
MLARFGEVGSRPCQNSLGDVVDLMAMGEDPYGDVSPLEELFWTASIYLSSYSYGWGLTWPC